MKLGHRLKSMVVYLKDKFSISVEFAEEGFKENFSKRFYKDKKLLKKFPILYLGKVKSL